MATAFKKPDGGVRLLVKGAPEKLQCTKVANPDGSTSDFDNDAFENIRSAYANRCFRTIGVAYSDFTDEEWEHLQESHNGLIETADRRMIDNNLTMVAMFGIEDPLRPGIN